MTRTEHLELGILFGLAIGYVVGTYIGWAALGIKMLIERHRNRKFEKEMIAAMKQSRYVHHSLDGEVMYDSKPENQS